VARPPHVPQSETELEEFFDLSIDPLSIIGFDGEFKRVNASFVRPLGYPKPELFSRSALDMAVVTVLSPAGLVGAQHARQHRGASADRGAVALPRSRCAVTALAEPAPDHA
jgi:PAS domain-containing protein